MARALLVFRDAAVAKEAADAAKAVAEAEQRLVVDTLAERAGASSPRAISPRISAAIFPKAMCGCSATSTTRWAISAP